MARKLTADNCLISTNNQHDAKAFKVKAIGKQYLLTSDVLEVRRVSKNTNFRFIG